MKLIDIHTHVYPDPIAQKATNSIQDFYGLAGGGMNGTVQTLLTRGAMAGISRYVVLPVATLPERTRHINQFIVELLPQHPEFVGFGTVHAAMEDLPGEVDYILSSGLRGIKMHPDTQRFTIDDPRLYPMYEAVSGRIPVILHMGDVRYDFSQPHRLRRVLEQFPRLQVIAAHFGGYGMYQEAYGALKNKECIFDISSSLMFMQPGVAEEYIGRYGAERMAYGTDYPLWDPVQEVKRFQQLRLTDAQFDQIAHKTAEAFLGL